MWSLLNLDWKSLLFGEEDLSFIPETMIRSVVMFVFIIFGLRLLGKRGVTQLSVFELGVIIGLGSAAGDPMFYKDVGLLVGMTVLIVVLLLYKLLTTLINRSDRIEHFMEGKPTTVLLDGCMLVHEFEKEPIARDELFSQLRMRNVTHLGQVQQAIVETDGEISVFYFPDDQVKEGLPILPQFHMERNRSIPKAGRYACTLCGNTQQLSAGKEHRCTKCNNNVWIIAIKEKRIT